MVKPSAASDREALPLVAVAQPHAGSTTYVSAPPSSEVNSVRIYPPFFLQVGQTSSDLGKIAQGLQAG